MPLNLDSALTGLEVPSDIRDSLQVVSVSFLSFSGEEQTGELIVHADLAEEVIAIFDELLAQRFPIEKIVPMTEYGWDDEKAMADNNTSAFNYRVIYGTQKLSNHSFGRAVDINTRINPYIARDGSVHPKNAMYDPTIAGTFVKGGPAVDVFQAWGWEWGGDWTDRKDWQHFEKPL